MNNQTSLFALIKSLSAKETELFRQHAFPPNKRTQKAVQWQMFKMLHNMDSYQPEKLDKLFPGKDAFKKQRLIGVNRFELKRKLLQFIGTLADETIMERHGQLQTLNVLYKKGLHYECHKLANQFKTEQAAAGQYSYATVANFYALMSAELSTEANSSELILKYADEQVKLCGDAYTNACVYRIYARLYVIQLGGVLITDKASRLEIQKLASDPILKGNPDDLSFNTRRYFYNANALAARLTGDITRAVYYTEQEYLLGQSREGHLLPTEEIQAICDVIHSYVLAGDAAKVKAWLKTFYTKLKHHQLSPATYRYLILHFELALAVLHHREAHKKGIAATVKSRGSAPAVKSVSGELHQKLIDTESYYLNSFQDINTGIRKILETNLAMGYYEYGDLTKSLRYFKAFLEQDINSEMGSRIKDIYHLFSLLVKYDLALSGSKKHTIESLAEECAKFRRKLTAKTNDEDVSVELAFLDCFSAIAKNHIDKKKTAAAFKKLLATLHSLKQNSLSYFSQLNSTFNLINWVEQRMK